ncbi:MAG: tRNA (guanosine(46)-N7)-methyltransferase TrmB [Holosporaceae bacterium]|jgi:tRNA (guanine-N(7)-)-methyltransferase|nr:tRNA (guanosine(46)-N7)-methyltransferase TrmB [Holosporaceae bacterium]
MREKRIIPSYGRKISHGLSETQKNNISDLYRLYGINLSTDMIDPIELFNGKFKKIILEIGFGNGEHLINHAILRPDLGFIGADPFENGLANILGEMRNYDLKNIKIFNGDARFLLEKLKKHSLHRVYILFPDPWRKRKHHKRRLLSTEFISDLIKKMVFGGNATVATDHWDYMLNVLKNLKKIPNLGYCDDINLLSQKPSCLLKTKYEQKALSEKKKCYYLRIYTPIT